MYIRNKLINYEDTLLLQLVIVIHGMELHTQQVVFILSQVQMLQVVQM
jgi:hypothetical protein